MFVLCISVNKIQNIRETEESKYSAEEKVVPEQEDEEEAFKKSVSERRKEIEKRLSEERRVPASAQRVEIVQEISSIKRQSLIEDKIKENEVDEKPQDIITTETVLIEPTKITTTTKTVTTSTAKDQKHPETVKTTVERVEIIKTTEKIVDGEMTELQKKLAAQKEKVEASERTQEKPQIDKEVVTTVESRTTTDDVKSPDIITHNVIETTEQDKRRDSALFEGVTQELERLETTKKMTPKPKVADGMYDNPVMKMACLGTQYTMYVF